MSQFDSQRGQRSPNSGADGRRLVGWLVSYGQNEMGASYELRSGRCFISSAEVGEATILVDDEHVCSPHAALKTSRKHAIVLQDVFSKYGTYLSKGDNKETRLAAPVNLEHGDWIRVGESTRFQVCIIDGPSK